MRSPFPEMDPYLEQFRGDVHHSMITRARDTSNSRSNCPGRWLRGSTCESSLSRLRAGREMKPPSSSDWAARWNTVNRATGFHKHHRPHGGPASRNGDRDSQTLEQSPGRRARPVPQETRRAAIGRRQSRSGKPGHTEYRRTADWPGHQAAIPAFLSLSPRARPRRSDRANIALILLTSEPVLRTSRTGHWLTRSPPGPPHRR